MLTVKQVSERLLISASLVYSWCEDHLLAHYRMGGKGKRGRILIEEAALDAFLQSQAACWYRAAHLAVLLIPASHTSSRVSTPPPPFVVERATPYSKTRLIASCWVEGYRCLYRFDVASFMCPAHSCTSR